MTISSLFGSLFGNLLNGKDDLVIPRTPTDMAVDVLPDFGLTRVWVIVQKVFCIENHTRSAHPALDGSLLVKGSLKWMWVIKGSQTLNRRDFSTPSVHGQHQTRIDWTIVH
jgi:hypothetical protein